MEKASSILGSKMLINYFPQVSSLEKRAGDHELQSDHHAAIARARRTHIACCISSLTFIVACPRNNFKKYEKMSRAFRLEWKKCDAFECNIYIFKVFLWVCKTHVRIFKGLMLRFRHTFIFILHRSSPCIILYTYRLRLRTQLRG